MNEFTRNGISFRYPENWRVELDESEDGGWAVIVSSPETAFALVSLRPDARDAADLADQTLETLRSDYKELDSENRVETITGRMAIGHDIDFLTVDVPVVCRVRAIESPSGPLLVMTQVAEPDRQRNESSLLAIVASLKVEEE
jgi:hypothetical protein